MLRWECQEYPGEKESQTLLDGVREEAVLRKGMTKTILPLGIFIKDLDGQVLGGIQGVTYYGCLYIDMLWLSEKLRNQGLGTRLMQEAERIGKQRLCEFSTVNTMDFEALSFYQKLGYKIEFVRSGYEKDSQMYYLTKKI